MAESLWVTQYIQETDSRARLEILENAIREEGATPENTVRKQLWEHRYAKQSGQELDRFIRGWMTLHFMNNSGKGLLARKRMRRETEEVLEDWGFAVIREAGEAGEKILYQEFKNATYLYMKLCQEDRTYGSILLGLGRMKEENLVAKIARDIYQVGYQIPQEFGLTETLAPFTRAATDAYLEKFDKQKEQLLSRIREGEQKQ